MLLKVFQTAGQTLSVIGTPPLFAIKILFWTAIWTGNWGLKILVAVFHLLTGIFTTSLWFGRAFLLAAGKFRLPPLPTLPTFKTPKLAWRFRPQNPTYFFAGATACFILIFIPYWLRSEMDKLPSPRLLAVRDISVSTKIYDRNGILLYSFYSDENRSLIALNQLPKHAIDATIAIEDKNFYSHLGFDIGGITRAVFANTTSGGFQGGSTITQQLVKSALLTPEQTWSRKIKELVLSFWAERLYSKEEILAMYLNQVPYGGAAYGIETAAQTYFGKPAKDLNLAESAFLAGLPSAPSVYSPYGTSPQLAKERQKQVLAAMVNQGYITASQANETAEAELKFNPPETSIKAPHFVMYVKDYLAQKYGSRTVEKGGLEVRTSLDYTLYEQVNQILREGVEKQKYLHVGNASTLITDPKTGEVLTMVGSKDFFDLKNDGNVNVTIAPRSPGSSIKPLNYALALEKGLISPAMIIEDSPTVYRVAGQPLYTPQNYDNRFHGKVTVRTALASSYNIPAVKVLEKNGLGNFLDFAQRLGINTFDDRSRFGLSVTLGGGEVKMTDMAVAFGTFATGGNRIDLKPVLFVKDYRGRVLEDNAKPAGGEKVLSSRVAFLISSILSDDAARAPAFGPGSVLNIPGRTVAVKTGTAQDKRDNWTIGYTPSYLVAVWVGNNDNSPMSPFLESGNTGAAAIWNPIMKAILANRPNEPFIQPDDVIAVTVCALNGLLPCENCPYVRTEYFVRGSEPKSACKFTKEEAEKILKPSESP